MPGADNVADTWAVWDGKIPCSDPACSEEKHVTLILTLAAGGMARFTTTEAIHEVRMKIGKASLQRSAGRTKATAK